MFRHAKRRPSSYEFRPVVVWREVWTGPRLTVRVDTISGKVAVLRVFENRYPRRGFWMLEPLRLLLAYQFQSRDSGCELQRALVVAKWGQHVVDMR